MAQLTRRDDLDTLFHALANEHRRAIVDVLSLHPSSISRLADLRGLSLPAIHKHIRILESAGLAVRRKLGRTNFLSLRREALQSLQDWTGRFHPYWGSDQETLANYERYLGGQVDAIDKRQRSPINKEAP